MAIKLSISGIRGTYQELTPQRIVNFCQAFATHVESGPVIIARDARPSGNFIAEAAIAGLMSCGCDVHDYGILPTPILQWILRNSGFVGGISITAGHNTFDWNSLIFLNSDGSYLQHHEGEEFFELLHSGQFSKKTYSALGAYTASNEKLDEYFAYFCKGETSSIQPLKIIVDCANGFPSTLLKQIGQAMGITIIPVFSSDNSFIPKDPEPNIRTASYLGTVVRETGSAGGFLLNSDASRVLVVDEQGRPLSEEMTLPLFARMILHEAPSDVITNYTTSKIIDSVARSYGVRVFRTDVGQPHVVQMVKESKAIIGGEGSGSIIYSPFSWGFDSFLFIKTMVDFIRLNQCPVSRLAGELPTPHIYKETIFLPPHRIYVALEKIGRLFPNRLNLKDGFYIELDEEDWLSVRASATVSMIRLIGEGARIQVEIDRIKEVLE